MIMRIAGAIGLVALLATDAFAQEDGVWGFMVFDHQGNFVTAKWPEQQTFIAGSSADAYLRLEGLAPLHAYFELRQDGFLVRRMYEAEVLVNGLRIESETIFDSRDTVSLGPYRMTFVLATDPPLEELPPAAGVEGGADGPTDPLVAADRAEKARKAEFDKKGYAFCHSEDFGKAGTPGVDFCVIFDDSSTEVCPEARKTCPNWKPYQPPVGGRAGKNGKGAGGVGEGGGQGGGEGAGAEGRRLVRRRVVLPIPKEVGIVLLVLVAGALIFWFVKSMMSAGWEGEELELDVDELSDAARNLQALPEARSNVLVKLAERALRRNDPEEAAILLHLAVLRYLDDEGLARYHPSKTNGDYLRAIRKLTELRDLFRGVATETERVRFGDGHVDAAMVARLIEEAKTLLRRAQPDSAEAPGTAALLVLLALVTPALQACPFAGEEEEDETIPAFYAHGPTGMAALPTILRDAGLEISISHDRFTDVEPGVGTIVFRTSAAGGGWPKEMRLDDLMDRNLSVVVIDDRARSSFFLPTTETTDLGPHAAVRLETNGPGPESFCSWRVAALRDQYVGPSAPVLPRGRRILWDGLSNTATVSRHRLHLHPLLIYENELEVGGRSAAAAYSADRFDEDANYSGCMYVFSDRDLFTNASLTRASNARFVAAFFAAITPVGQKVVILDRVDTWSTSGSSGGGGGGGGGAGGGSNHAKAMKASNMMPFVLQALLTMVLLFMLLGAAFGPLRDPAKREHKSFVEHVEAIGRQYARTGPPGLSHAAHSLAKLLVMRHRDRVRGGPSGGWLALSKHLSETHELPHEDVKAALRLGIEGVSELGTPRIDDPNPSSERMLKTLSRLLGARSNQGKR